MKDNKILASAETIKVIFAVHVLTVIAAQVVCLVPHFTRTLKCFVSLSIVKKPIRFIFKENESTSEKSKVSLDA